MKVYAARNSKLCTKIYFAKKHPFRLAVSGRMNNMRYWLVRCYKIVLFFFFNLVECSYKCKWCIENTLQFVLLLHENLCEIDKIPCILHCLWLYNTLPMYMRFYIDISMHYIIITTFKLLNRTARNVVEWKENFPLYYHIYFYFNRHPYIYVSFVLWVYFSIPLVLGEQKLVWSWNKLNKLLMEIRLIMYVLVSIIVWLWMWTQFI